MGQPRRMTLLGLGSTPAQTQLPCLHPLPPSMCASPAEGRHPQLALSSVRLCIREMNGPAWSKCRAAYMPCVCA
jgi:hypothetical protein